MWLYLYFCAKISERTQGVKDHLGLMESIETKCLLVKGLIEARNSKRSLEPSLEPNETQFYFQCKKDFGEWTH